MLEILISSSVLILVLAMLRLVLRGKLDPRLQYALWLLVLFRLLVPVHFFHSPVSVAEAAAPAVARMERLSGTVLSRGAAPEPPEAVPAATEAERIIPAWTLRDAAREVWHGGMAVMAAWFLAVNARLALRLKKTRTPYTPGGRPPVYVAEDIPSPCLFGLLRPAIYLTERAAEDGDQARLILAHERTHLRHGDLLWALLRSVCLTVWWFNPLVWLAAALSRQDGELACDAGTIRALGEEARFEYGRTLVGMARVGTGRPSELLSGATAMTTGKRSLRERVARIAQARRPSLLLAVLALLIAAVAAGCAFTGTPEADPGLPEPTPSPAAYEGARPASGSPADAAEPEIIGVLDREYWEEVDRNLADFAYPADIEVFVSEGFDETLPEDDLFGPMTLEDYIYSTDSWRFDHDSGPLANDPLAAIKVHDADGRTLWIMEDTDALMIEAADGSVVWARIGPDGDDGAALIRRLLPWARGEHPTEDMKAQKAEQDAVIYDAILDELGLYGLPGYELFHREAYEFANDYPLSIRPSWAGSRTLFFGSCVRLAYGTKTNNIELLYERFWADEARTTLSNEEEFLSAEEMYRQIPDLEMTDDLSVGGHKAFAWEANDLLALMWYDADKELVFTLTDYAFGEPPRSAPLEALIALAETVGPM